MTKLCPYKKIYTLTTSTGQEYVEDFQECIGEDCAAYYTSKKYNGYGTPIEISHKCSLLNNELYKEKLDV